MSLGNTNIHQRGEIPEIIKLPNDRIRVVRRFQKFTREDVDNVNLGSLMGDFGVLDDLDEQIPEQGYDNCRLISVEVDTRFNSISNADNAVLTKTYETLTNAFVEITDPTVEIQESGLAKITKTYRAISGTKPPNKIGIQAAYAATNPTNNVIVTSSGEGSGIYTPNETFNKWVGIDASERYEFFNTEAGEGAGQWVWRDVVDGNPLYFSTTNGYLPWEVEWPLASGLSFNLVNNSTVYGRLAESEVEDNTAFAELTEIYLEAGEVDRLEESAGDGVKQVTVTNIWEEPTVGAGKYIISKDVNNVEGVNFITTSFLESKDGTGLTESDGGEKLIYEYQQLVPFVFPGVVNLREKGGNVYPAVRSPVECDVRADVLTYYQTSSDIEDTDYTKDSAVGLWNPSEWCQKIATIDSFYNQDTGQVEPAYFNAQGMRGCRTRTAFRLEGLLADEFSTTALDFTTFGNEQTINALNLEETIEIVNGKSVYEEVYEYTRDSVRRISINNLGVFIIQNRSLLVEGKLIIRCEWNGSQWELKVTHTVTDPMASDGANTSGTFTYTYSAALGGYVDVYTNQTQTIASGTVIFTSTNGSVNPDGADWSSGITVTPLSNEERVGSTSLDSATLGYSGGSTALVSGFGGWIEGRRSPLNADGELIIRGGPDNPNGKRYVLDVNIKKAFTDTDGTDIYQKQIVVATCSPAT